MGGRPCPIDRQGFISAEDVTLHVALYHGWSLEAKGNMGKGTSKWFWAESRSTEWCFWGTHGIHVDTTLGNLTLGLSSFSHVPEKSQEGNRHSSPSTATLLWEHSWIIPSYNPVKGYPSSKTGSVRQRRSWMYRTPIHTPKTWKQSNAQCQPWVLSASHLLNAVSCQAFHPGN